MALPPDPSYDESATQQISQRCGPGSLVVYDDEEVIIGLVLVLVL
jgi:hypothetical protein